MRRWLVLGLLVFSPAANAAPGLNLSWDECGTLGVSAKSFSCDTDSGEDVLVASFVAAPDMPAFSFVRAYFEIRFDTPFPPPWWSFDPWNLGCRFGYLSPTTDAFGIQGCAVPWMPAKLRLVTAKTSVDGTRALVLFTMVREAGALPLETEIFLFKVFLTHKGTLVCEGCDQGVEIAFTELAVSQGTGPAIYSLLGPAQRNVVTWNGGLVPTRPTSWGQIQALYR